MRRMDSKFDAFYALEEEKKQRILDAALEEFGKKSFKTASTNAIAKNAGIGKGMLFYYFGSKEELFHFICEYALEFARHELVGKFICTSRDFLKRQKELSMFKAQVMQKYPLIMAFFESLYHRPENAPYVEQYREEIQSDREAFIGKLYDDVDETLFVVGVDPKRVMKYLNWIIKAYTDELEEKWAGKVISEAEREQGLAKEWENYDVLMEDLRLLFYK